MDTIAPKTPATLPFAAWQAMKPAAAAREVHTRIAALPAPLRSAALAWLKPEPDLAGDLSAGQGAGPLAAVPYLLKDLFDLQGVPTQAGSTFLNQTRGLPAADSVIVRRLRELGATCAGKTHLVEFAAGLFGDNAHYGDCPHPHAPDRLSGGSSSGSAALVAAGVVPFAIGTDTGGSVRVPAAFCGNYGFRLNPHGDFIRDAMALSPSLDTAGWFTGNAADMLTLWVALVDCRVGASRRTGPATSADPTGNFKSPRGCFLPAQTLGILFDPDTASACDRAAAAFAAPADQATTTALLASWQNGIEAYTITALSEAHTVHRDWLAPYHEHYEPSIWQRFSDGGHYTPEQLAQARSTVATVREGFQRYFARFDYLVLPATPFPALRKADCTPDARKQLLTLTMPASLGGLPVLTIPVPLPSGLTTGLQIILPAADSSVVPWLLKRQGESSG
jgi:amidase/aspartyl-tRNA(Asn)/glutamyl-tRNA(Gln) amidotransferase subunit A